MVRGIFSDIKFPFAHFPTKDVAGDHLFSVMWEAIERIERLGLKVVALTADGSSSNRNFFACVPILNYVTEPKISMLVPSEDSSSSKKFYSAINNCSCILCILNLYLSPAASSPTLFHCI